jgi:hypothetical protein
MILATFGFYFLFFLKVKFGEIKLHESTSAKHGQLNLDKFEFFWQIIFFNVLC